MTAVSFALVAGCGVAIAKLVDDVLGNDGATQIDPTVTDFFVRHRTPWVTALARTVTHLADPLIVTLAVIVGMTALVALRRRRLAAFVALSAIGSASATSLGKLVVDRPRPLASLWLSPASGAAFPSGHATQSVACWCALAVCAALLTRRRWLRGAWLALGAALAVAIGASRVYLGVHWASDVVCGWAVATAWLLALVLIGWSRPRLETEVVAARRQLRQLADSLSDRSRRHADHDNE